MKKTILTSILAAAALAAAAVPAQAAVTIGSNLASNANSNACGGTDCTTTNLALGGDVAPNGLVSPVTGTVTSWRFKSASSGNTVSLRVLRPGGTVAFTGAGTSVAVTSDNGINGPFTTSLPIRAGDHVGLNRSNGAIVMSTDVIATQLYWTLPVLAEGSTRDGTTAVNQEVLVQAVVDPSNTLKFGKPVLNKKKGVATVAVDVPNPGQLAVAGEGVKVIGTPSTVTAAGAVTVTVKATGKKRRKLNAKGKVTVSPSFTYTPSNGTTRTQVATVKLVKTKKK
jgi:hypothetical protein